MYYCNMAFKGKGSLSGSVKKFKFDFCSHQKSIGNFLFSNGTI